MPIPQNNRKQLKMPESPTNLNEASRREFLLRGGAGFGALALTGMLARDKAIGSPNASKQPHFAPTAKRVIFLFMEGGPSHMDLFDPKPLLNKLAGQTMPASFKRPITPMGETESPLLACPRQWKRHGQSGLWVSDWLPHTAECVDDLAVIRSCWTNGINHSGGVCQMNTGQPMGGRPSLGAGTTYGLGSESENLPGFVVFSTGSKGPSGGPSNWGSGFLPTIYQGVQFRTAGDPVLYLSDPPGISRETRKRMLAGLGKLNRKQFEVIGDPEIETRIAQFELAHRMQTSVPALTDLSRETQTTCDLYGPDSTRPGTFAANCLLARRMAERDVRFIQLYHRGWDQHYNLPSDLRLQCRDVDQPCAALIEDLKQRGLLDEVIIMWTGEFGRLPITQGADGRDHNRNAFSLLMAGGGFKAGHTHGETDEFGYRSVEGRVSVPDLHATILHQLGIDHHQLSYPHAGRPERLTDPEVTGARVVEDLLV